MFERILHSESREIYSLERGFHKLIFSIGSAQTKSRQRPWLPGLGKGMSDVLIMDSFNFCVILYYPGLRDFITKGRHSYYHCPSSVQHTCSGSLLACSNWNLLVPDCKQTCSLWSHDTCGVHILLLQAHWHSSFLSASIELTLHPECILPPRTVSNSSISINLVAISLSNTVYAHGLVWLIVPFSIEVLKSGLQEDKRQIHWTGESANTSGRTGVGCEAADLLLEAIFWKADIP